LATLHIADVPSIYIKYAFGLHDKLFHHLLEMAVQRWILSISMWKSTAFLYHY